MPNPKISDQNFEQLKQNYTKYIKALGRALMDAGVQNLGDVAILCAQDALNKCYAINSITKKIEENNSWDQRGIQEYGKVLTKEGLRQELKYAKTPAIIEALLRDAAHFGLTEELAEPIAEISSFVKTETIENEFKKSTEKETQIKQETQKDEQPALATNDALTEQIQEILDIFMIFMPEKYNELAALEKQQKPSFVERSRAKPSESMLAR